MPDTNLKPATYLCRLDEIPDGAGRGFAFGEGTDRYALFVVRQGDSWSAWENSCPHLGTPLDFVRDRFMSKSGRYIQCSTHLAQFRVADGHCVVGPCEGAALTPAPVRLADGDLILQGSSPESPENAAVQ